MFRSRSTTRRSSQDPRREGSSTMFMSKIRSSISFGGGHGLVNRASARDMSEKDVTSLRELFASLPVSRPQPDAEAEPRAYVSPYTAPAVNDVVHRPFGPNWWRSGGDEGESEGGDEDEDGCEDGSETEGEGESGSESEESESGDEDVGEIPTPSNVQCALVLQRGVPVTGFGLPESSEDVLGSRSPIVAQCTTRA